MSKQKMPTPKHEKKIIFLLRKNDVQLHWRSGHNFIFKSFKLIILLYKKHL